MYDQAMIISVDLSAEFGSDEDHQLCFKLEDDLIDLIEPKLLGIVDGHEFGNDEFTLYVYSKDIDNILSICSDVLKNFPLKPVRIKLRYGDVSDKKAKEVQKRFF